MIAAAADRCRHTRICIRTRTHTRSRTGRSRSRSCSPLPMPPFSCCSKVVVNNQLALHNTALLRAYMAAFPGARPLCVLIKAWAARRNLNKAAHGTLSSYAHVLTLVHCLSPAARCAMKVARSTLETLGAAREDTGLGG